MKLGRQGFKTPEEARLDAQRSITMEPVILQRSRPCGQTDYAWVWPKEHADRLVAGNQDIRAVA